MHSSQKEFFIWQYQMALNNDLYAWKIMVLSILLVSFQSKYLPKLNYGQD